SDDDGNDYGDGEDQPLMLADDAPDLAQPQTFIFALSIAVSITRRISVVGQTRIARTKNRGFSGRRRLFNIGAGFRHVCYSCGSGPISIHSPQPSWYRWSNMFTDKKDKCHNPDGPE